MPVETIMTNHAELMRIASANFGQISVWRLQLQILQYTRDSLLRENSLSVLDHEISTTSTPPEVQELNGEIKKLSEIIRNAMEKLCPNIDFPI